MFLACLLFKYFELKIKDNLCFFALSSIKIKEKKGTAKEKNPCTLIHKMFKETLKKRKTVILQIRKNE